MAGTTEYHFPAGDMEQDIFCYKAEGKHGTSNPRGLVEGR